METFLTAPTPNTEHLTSNAVDVHALQTEFPSLGLRHNGRPMIFFDNPGGTQVPQRVIDAVGDYYRTSNANSGGAFPTSRRTDAVVLGAREAVADLLNAPSTDSIVFGPNMTS